MKKAATLFFQTDGPWATTTTAGVTSSSPTPDEGGGCRRLSVKLREQCHPQNIIRSADRFGYRPSYTYRAYRSVVGGLLSLLTFVLMGYYVVTTATMWVESLPALQFLSFLNLRPDFHTTAPPFGVRLRLNNEYWYNTSYVSVSFKHISLNSRTGAKTTVTLGTQPCNTTAAIGLALCPTLRDASVPLQGRYTDEIYRYIEVAVTRCSKGCSGLTSAQITAFLANNIDLVFVRTSQDLDLEHQKIVTDTTTDRWQFRSDTYFKVEAPWRRRTIQRVDKYMGKQRMPHLLLTFTSYYTVTADLGSTFFKFFVRMDALETRERITPTATLLDLCGRFGAVFSFLSVLSLGTLGLLYNRLSFQRRFYGVLEEAGIPPAAQDIRLFDKHHFNKFGELDPMLLKSTANDPRTAMDNLRHMVLQSTKAIDTRKTKLRDVMDANEPLYWPRKARHAFERWRRQTHPHKYGPYQRPQVSRGNSNVGGGGSVGGGSVGMGAFNRILSSVGGRRRSSSTSVQPFSAGMAEESEKGGGSNRSIKVVPYVVRTQEMLSATGSSTGSSERGTTDKSTSQRELSVTGGTLNLEAEPIAYAITASNQQQQQHNPILVAAGAGTDPYSGDKRGQSSQRGGGGLSQSQAGGVLSQSQNRAGSSSASESSKGGARGAPSQSQSRGGAGQLSQSRSGGASPI